MRGLPVALLRILPFQKGWPATVVGIKRPASIAADQRGTMPSASAAPASVIASAFARTANSGCGIPRAAAACGRLPAL